LEEPALALRYRVAIAPRAFQRCLACPHQNIHPEGFAIARDRCTNPSISVDTQCIPAQAVADPDLPGSGAKRVHLLGNLPHGRDDQTPRQFRGSIGGAAGVLIRRYDDAAMCTCVDVDMRVDAALADQPQRVEAIEQGLTYVRTLANQHERLRVFEAPGQRIDVLRVIGPDRDLVAVQLAKARESTKSVEVV